MRSVNTCMIVLLLMNLFACDSTPPITTPDGGNTTPSDDTSPDAFSFEDQTGVELNALIESNVITISGINAPAEMSITGGEYSIDGGEYLASASTVTEGQTVAVRQTSSASFSTQTDAVLTIGDIEDTFSVTTLAEDTEPDAFSFSDQTDVAIDTLIASNSIIVSGINSAAAISVVGGEYAIDDGGFTSDAGTVSNGQSVTLRQISSAQFSTQSDTLLTIGGVSDTFSVQTIAVDTTPDPFGFVDQTEVELSTQVISNSITVSGINSGSAISVVGGEYAIDGGAYTAASGIISNGQTVSLRQTSSAEFSTQTDATLTIGGVSDTFSLITVESTPLLSPELSVQPSVKTLTFSWSAVDGATYYRLLENPDGASGFSQIGDDIDQDVLQYELDIAVHKTDWFEVRYVLEACNDGGCASSDALDVMDLMLNTIGYFKASNTEAYDNFGFHVVLSEDGNTMAVSTPREASAATGVDGDQTDNSASSAGAVYVFVKENDQWIQQAYLKASNTEEYDSFGWSMDISNDGDYLAVGAPSEASNSVSDQNNNGASWAGAVYVFHRSSGNNWSQRDYIKGSNTESGDQFGYAVALSGNGQYLVASAIHEDSSATSVNGNEDNGGDRNGAVYVFMRLVIGWGQQAYIKGSNTDESDEFGHSLALDEDGNILAVGAPYEKGDGTDQNNNDADYAGAVYTFSRAGSTWTQTDYLKASNVEADDMFGSEISLSDDGNTLLVGAPGESSNATGVDGDENNNDAPSSGAAYIFDRSINWTQRAYIKASNTSSNHFFGSRLAISQDANTIAIGSQNDSSAATGINGDDLDISASDAGAVYLFIKESWSWQQKAYIKASNTGLGDQFGGDVALNGNGNSLAVGAIGEASNDTDVNGDQSNNDAIAAGAVYVY